MWRDMKGWCEIRFEDGAREAVCAKRGSGRGWPAWSCKGSRRLYTGRSSTLSLALRAKRGVVCLTQAAALAQSNRTQSNAHPGRDTPSAHTLCCLFVCRICSKRITLLAPHCTLPARSSAASHSHANTPITSRAHAPTSRKEKREQR